MPKKRLERNLGGLNLSASSQHLTPGMSEILQFFGGETLNILLMDEILHHLGWLKPCK